MARMRHPFAGFFGPGMNAWGIIAALIMTLKKQRVSPLEANSNFVADRARSPGIERHNRNTEASVGDAYEPQEGKVAYR